MPRTFMSIGVFLYISIASKLLFAQMEIPLVLNNHTFKGSKAFVGAFYDPENTSKFKVLGENAKFFKIQGQSLSVIPNKIPDDLHVIDIIIERRNSSGKQLAEFRILRDRFLKNGVIAHRGAFKNTGAAENSILALKHAVGMGCAGSEFDIHMSQDSIPFVNHDETIDGVSIAQTSAKKLSLLKLSSGENMPTLEEYLKEGISQTSTKLILEIKPSSSKERVEELTRRVVKMVQDMKAQAWVDYISFDYNSCLEIKRLDPFARVAYLKGDKSPEIIAEDKLWGLDYHFDIFKKNPNWITKAKEKGLTINTWTVNEPELMKWFLDRNIDFITTNEPETLLKLRERK